MNGYWIRKCAACSFSSHIREWGQLEPFGVGDGWAHGMIGKLAGEHIGGVDIIACPKCGTLKCDFRNSISELKEPKARNK